MFKTSKFSFNSPSLIKIKAFLSYFFPTEQFKWGKNDIKNEIKKLLAF